MIGKWKWIGNKLEDLDMSDIVPSHVDLYDLYMKAYEIDVDIVD